MFYLGLAIGFMGVILSVLILVTILGGGIRFEYNKPIKRGSGEDTNYIKSR